MDALDIRMHTFYEGEGMWAGVAQIRPSRYEYRAAHASAIQLLEGAATVTVEGRPVELAAGDVFFLEKGAETSWEVTATIREYFVGFVDEDVPWFASARSAEFA